MTRFDTNYCIIRNVTLTRSHSQYAVLYKHFFMLSSFFPVTLVAFLFHFLLEHTLPFSLIRC